LKWLLVAALLASSCKLPLAECTVLCGDNNGCPRGLTCNQNDGYCHNSGDTRLCPASDGGDTSCPGNMITNPGFELADLSHWTTARATLSRIAGGHSGAFEGQLCSDGAQRDYTLEYPDSFAATAGAEYTLSFWMRSDSPYMQNVAPRICIDTVGQGGCNMVGATAVKPGWQQVMQVQAVPGDAGVAQIYSEGFTVVVLPLNTSACVELDDFCMTQTK
jgi:hypothetical protein